MCGIFGYVSKQGAPVDMGILRKVAQVTEQRGPHSFGFAWLDSRDRLRMFKQAGRVSDHLSMLRMAADARILIGHCRFATHGSPENNLNNHPHPCDGGWIVHNGVIHNHNTLNEDYCLNPVTDCDSESLALLAEEIDGTLADRVIAAASLCEGNLAMMGLWRKRMIALRDGNPLHVGANKQGWFIASLRTGLPGNVIRVQDETALVFDKKSNGGWSVQHFDMAEVNITTTEVA